MYEAALARLAAHQTVYACACSRRSLAGSDDAPSGSEIPYRGRCRDRGLAPAPGLGLRLALEAGEERFDDPQAQDPARQCGDVPVQDRLGYWTYQFAVAVDDHRQGVDPVVRGADLLASVGRQIRLARLLGRLEPPVYLHHPLLFKPSGEKLSKAARDTGIRDLSAGGARPEYVLGEAAFRAGLLPERRPIEVAALVELFRGGGR